MKTTPLTVAEYLAALPADRRAILNKVRQVVRKNLDKPYAEGIQYGMISYYVPHHVYPAGYRCDPSQPLPFAALAAHKNYLSLYLMCLYSNAAELESFRVAWAQTGKKLDMGKSCIRFKSVDDLALDAIAELLRGMPAKRFIEHYEAATRKESTHNHKRPIRKAASAGRKAPRN